MRATPNTSAYVVYVLHVPRCEQGAWQRRRVDRCTLREGGGGGGGGREREREREK
jgi:hypothetical protein